MNRATIHILSLFPEPLDTVLNSSILRRAQAKGIVELTVGNLRDFAQDKHKSVDDAPFGGKQGMLFMAPVLEAAMRVQLETVSGKRENLKVIYTSPRGVRAEQPLFEGLARWLVRDTQGLQTEEGLVGMGPELLRNESDPKRIVVVAGRYEGVDERFINRWVDLEFSLGDFILTGGELPALVLVDGVVRLLPGVLGNALSRQDESFSNGLLEYPQYTRPREFAGQAVPEVLVEGHHLKIQDWNLRQSLLLTAAFRPDLLLKHQGQGLPGWAADLLEELKKRIYLRA